MEDTLKQIPREAPMRRLGIAIVWLALCVAPAFGDYTADVYLMDSHFLFGLRRGASPSVGIFDAAGHQVRSLPSGQVGAGYHSVIWDGRNDAGAPVSSGLYFIRFQAAEVSQVRKVLLAR